MKHLLSIVTLNADTFTLVVIDPTNNTITHSKQIALLALDDLVEKDRLALLSSLPTETDGKPGHVSSIKTKLVGVSENGNAVYATSAFASGWDGSDGNDGYGPWRTGRWRFRILEIDSVGITITSTYDRMLLLKEGMTGGGGIFGSFNGDVYFKCTKPESFEIVKLSAGGGASMVSWVNPVGNDGDIAFASSGNRTMAIINKDETPN